MKRSEVNKMSLQEICDLAMLKIVEQGGRCLLDTGEKDLDVDFPICAYVNGDKHCAVGWLLDHDEKDLSGYKGSIFKLAKEFPEIVPAKIKEYINLFELLQRIHDTSMPYKIEAIYEKLERHFGIDTSAPQWSEWEDMRCNY